MISAYTTPIASVIAPTWLPLSPGLLVTSEPLRSSDGVATYARLGYRAALEVAASFDAELPTRADVLALHQLARSLGTELRPVTLPTAAICAAHGVEWHDEAGKQRLREQYMMGAGWCAAHDEYVEPQVTMMWQPRETMLLANIGKLWIAGASPGRARLMGWWVNGAWIQDGLYPVGDTTERHVDTYADYSSVVVLVTPA